jgi:hypothetical protein
VVLPTADSSSVATMTGKQSTLHLQEINKNITHTDLIEHTEIFICRAAYTGYNLLWFHEWQDHTYACTIMSWF